MMSMEAKTKPKTEKEAAAEALKKTKSIKDLNMAELVFSLNSSGLLTPDDFAELTSERTLTNAKIKYLIQILPSKKHGWWDDFFKCLKDTSTATNHEAIAEEFQGHFLCMKQGIPERINLQGQIGAEFRSGLPVQEAFRSMDMADETDSGTKNKLSKSAPAVTVDELPRRQPRSAAQILEDEYKKWVKIIDFSVDKGFPRDEIKVLIEVVNQCEFHAAMLEMMDGKVTEHIINQCDSCFVGKWGDVPVVIVQTAMGQKYHASYDTTKEVLKAMPHIKYVFGVGVCGGVKGRVELGEIVVSSIIIGYDKNKTMPGLEDNRDYMGTCENQDFYQFIKKSKWDGAKVHFGPVLSGSKIVADSKTQVDLCTNFCPTALAFEMEGRGIAAACDHNQDNKVHCLIIKGVSDHADKHKNDDWQPDAAKYAAAYLKYMLNEFFGRNIL